MKHLDRRNALKALTGTAAITGTAIVTTLSTSVVEAAQSEQSKPDQEKQWEIKVPASLTEEHEELHEELVRLTKAGGKTGEAARTVAKVLHPHFVKEEELAMPPLGLLRPLAEGQVQPEMAQVIELTDKLKKDMPTMLKEHEAIVAALEVLAEAGKQENKPQAEQFAKKLRVHAQVEEDLIYPAAILVGEYVKLKLNK